MTAPARFKQADVQRAIKAVQACGLVVGTVRIAPSGEIVVYSKDAGNAPRENPLDRLLDGP